MSCATSKRHSVKDMRKKRPVDEMNRFELMNELERVKESDRTEEYGREISRLQAENEKLKEKLDVWRQQVMLTAHHLDYLARSSEGLRYLLDTADDLRRGALKPLDGETPPPRSLKDRRQQSQGRRKGARRSKG